jgi:ABC-type multidrug transport system fused ATPase/permease subunit
MSQILIELVKLANLIITITKALACANRIENVLELQSSMEWEQDVAEQASDYVVEFDHVHLHYAGAGAESLSDIDFKVKRGQTIGIIGGTGSGKSSLVNMIPRFYDASKGTVRIDGRDVRAYSMEELRQKVGVVLQKAVLFHGTIRDNLRWGKEDATDAEIWQALEIAQAKEFVEQKEGKLDAQVAQEGRNLSGGQRQRLTIARALIGKPEILILDDSTSALDYATDAALRHAIRTMEGDMTVFIVSQRTASLQYADQIIVLDDGEVVGLGTHQELLKDCKVYQEIYYSQMG